MIKKSNVYIRFLKMAGVLNSKSKIRSLDSIEKDLLNTIMLDDHSGQSILVGDLLKLNLIGSQATLHGRLKNLLSIGYIQFIPQEDGRKKSCSYKSSPSIFWSSFCLHAKGNTRALNYYN